MLLVAFSLIYITRFSGDILSTIKSNLTYSLSTTNSLYKLNGILSNLEKSVSILASTAEESFSADYINKEKLLDGYLNSFDGLLRQTTLKTDLVEGSWIQLNPEISLNRGSYYSSWFHYQGKNLIKHPKIQRELTEESDPYYFQPAKTGKPNWTDVYIDPFINVDMITYSIPIYKNRILIGVAGADLSLQGLNSILAQIHSKYSGSEIFLINGNFKIISLFPYDKNKINKNLFDFNKNLLPLKNRLKEKDTPGNIDYRERNENKIAVFSGLSNQNYLIMTVPTSTVYKNFNILINISYILFFILVLVTVYALWGKYRLQRALTIIKEQEVLQRMIMESTGNGFILFDSQNNISLANNTFFEIFRLSDESRNIKKGELMRVAVSKEMKEPELFVKNTKEIFSTFGVHKDSYELNYGRIIERLTLPIFIDKEYIGRLCNFREITDIKKLENSLRESKAQLQAILDNMPFMAWLKDKDGRFIAVNHPFVKACSCSVEEIIGNKECSVWTEELARVYIEDDLEVMKNGRQISVEQPVNTKEGQRWFETFKTPVLNNDGEVVGMAGLARDITDRKKAEMEILLQNEKMASIGTLTAGIAHEINNPIAGIIYCCENITNRISPSIKGNIKIAEECGLDINMLKEYFEKRDILRSLEEISNAAERISKIVNDMLVFSRKATARQKCNVQDVLDSAVGLVSNDFNISNKYDFRKINIKREYSEIPEILCKKTDLEQVFVNMLMNSAQSMKADNQNPEITIRCYRKDDYIRVEIEDNGCGMDEATRKKIFEPFFTTKEVGVGTGLGLAVSYFIITNTHNGRISVKSEIDKGTMLIVELPAD